MTERNETGSRRTELESLLTEVGQVIGPARSLADFRQKLNTMSEDQISAAISTIGKYFETYKTKANEHRNKSVVVRAVELELRRNFIYYAEQDKGPVKS